MNFNANDLVGTHGSCVLMLSNDWFFVEEARAVRSYEVIDGLSCVSDIVS